MSNLAFYIFYSVRMKGGIFCHFLIFFRITLGVSDHFGLWVITYGSEWSRWGESDHFGEGGWSLWVLCIGLITFGSEWSLWEWVITLGVSDHFGLWVITYGSEWSLTGRKWSLWRGGVITLSTLHCTDHIWKWVITLGVSDYF
jgi:hypothetical protein